MRTHMQYSKFAMGLLFGCLANTNIEAASVCSIDNVDSYLKAWNGSLNRDCSRFEIADTLYGSIAFLARSPAITQDPVYVYPSGFQFAWISVSDNLQQYLAWRLGPDGDTFRGLTLPIGLYAGLPESYVTGDGMYLAVIDYSTRPTEPRSAPMSPEVPTAAFWFHTLRNLHNVRLQLDAQKTFATNDPNLPGSGEGTMTSIDPIAHFIDMTGTSYNGGPRCSGDSYKCATGNSSCRGWQNVMERLMPLDPYKTGGSTAACIASFNDYVMGRDATASEYRAMLNRCQDVNPCNTFLGFGYSRDYADYLAGLPGQHYAYGNSFTGPEFIVPNIDMRGMISSHRATFIHLPANSGIRP